MAQFSFSNSILELDIAGTTFAVDTGLKDTMEKCAAFAKGAAERSAALGADNAGQDQIEQATQYVLSCVDDLLGAGASQKIFAGRTTDIIDAVDIMNYVLKEIVQQRSKRFERYLPNRQQ
jgi:hypothetical protein